MCFRNEVMETDTWNCRSEYRCGLVCNQITLQFQFNWIMSLAVFFHEAERISSKSPSQRIVYGILCAFIELKCIPKLYIFIFYLKHDSVSYYEHECFLILENPFLVCVYILYSRSEHWNPNVMCAHCTFAWKNSPN